jgi:hypothetical protein
VRGRIENDELVFDQAIVRHGYADDMRDYDVLVEPYTSAGGPGLPLRPVGRFRYRFTHCPTIAVVTRLTDETWQASWDDAFLDHDAYREAGEPDGFLWAVEYADAYPGLSYVENSDRARMWSERLGHQMHEVILETNVYSLQLVFHDLVVTQVAWYDAERGGMVDSSGAIIDS